MTHTKSTAIKYCYLQDDEIWNLFFFCRNLREEKNSALSEQERLNGSEKETQLQYTHLLAE